MKTIVKKYKGWAISSNTDKEYRLLGNYWNFDGKPMPLPIGMRGHLIAVFSTRREAREALIIARKTFPKSRVERVFIDISIEG